MIDKKNTAKSVCAETISQVCSDSLLLRSFLSKGLAHLTIYYSCQAAPSARPAVLLASKSTARPLSLKETRVSAAMSRMEHGAIHKDVGSFKRFLS